MEEASGTIARPRELLLVSLAGLLLALLMTWPLATDLAHLGRTLGTDADGQFSIWNVSWVARTIVADPAHLFDANIFSPHQDDAGLLRSEPAAGVIGIRSLLALANPWLTLNLVMLVGFASAYAGAWLLLRHVCGDRGAAAAGAILYAFCPYVMSHLSHIQLLFTGGIPLSLLLLHRLADEAFADAARQRVWLPPSGGRSGWYRARTRARGAGARLRLLRHLRRPDGRLCSAGAGGERGSCGD